MPGLLSIIYISMQRLLVVFLGFIFLQCSTPPENEIPLFNNIVYHLDNGESIGDITPNTVALYDSLFNGPNSEIPLFRNIRHRDYTLFIGLPFNTSYEQLIKNKSGKSDTLLIAETITDSFFFTKYRIKNTTASECVVKIKDKSLVFIATLSNAENKTDSLFTSKNLYNRISTK